MLDLDKIPKKTLRRSKWLTVLMLFLAIGFTPAYLDSISNVLVFAFLVSLVTKPTFVFRWLLPLMLIGVAWAIQELAGQCNFCYQVLFWFFVKWCLRR